MVNLVFFKLEKGEAGTPSPAEDLIEQLREQLAAREQQLAARDAQITAKDQKIQNLRTQISRAHVSLTEEREGRAMGPS